MGLLQGLVDTVGVVGWQETQQPGSCSTKKHGMGSVRPRGRHSHSRIHGCVCRPQRTAFLEWHRFLEWPKAHKFWCHHTKTSCNTGISSLKTRRDTPSSIFLSSSCPSLVRGQPCCLLEVWGGAPVGNWSNVELPHVHCVFTSTTGNRRGNSQRGSETSVKMREKHPDFACTAGPKTEKPRGRRSFFTDFERPVGRAPFTGAPQI